MAKFFCHKEKSYEVRATLRWLSTWRDHNTEDPDRSIEFMDIGLTVDENHMQVLTRNGRVQENSAWSYVKMRDDRGYEQDFLALKLSTSNFQNAFRYYGFTWKIMTMDGNGGYLCQNSVKDENNSEHTITSYMEMFKRKEYKEEQKIHITLVHKEGSSLTSWRSC